MVDNIDEIYVFGDKEEYWHIICRTGYSPTWTRNELQIETSCLTQQTVKDRFAYLTALAQISELKGDDGDALLYDKLYYMLTDVLEYEGDFKDDMRHGSGTSYSENGAVEYSGEWRYDDYA